MKKKKIFKKDLKQQLKSKNKNILKNLFKKINYYLFYIKKYPQSLIKAFFLLLISPKKFIKKLKNREKIIEKAFIGINVERNFSFINLKEKIKNNIKNLINFIEIIKQKLVDKKIQKNLESFFKKRTANSFDIFIFSIIAFNYRIQRPQHFAFEMAKKGHRIFYIENEFLINKNIDNNGFAPYLIKKKAENIYLIKLSSSKNYFIYNQTPSKKDLELMFASIKKLIYDAFVINPIAKIDHPFWGFLKEKLAMPIIYDCMDEHSGFKENSKKILKKEEELIKNSDIVLASSTYLYHKLKKYQPKKLFFLPNGGEFEHFNKILNENKIPSDIKNIKKPIIGYYGAIDYWFDEKLLEKILIKFKNSNIVLIGRVVNKNICKLNEIYKNLYLLGEKNYNILPNYLKYFDVCLIPFKINKLIKATHPVKVYEYLAQGKPVVSSYLPEIKNLNKLIYLSKNHHQFLKNIKIALNEKNHNLIKKRIDFSAKNQWSEKINTFLNYLDNNFYPKVSIVILSFFNWQITKKCIDSILHYSFYPNFEIIIVDNNSDHQTKEYLKSLNNKKLKVILSKENLGFGGGNNLGMKNISKDSKFIILLNNDTIITPGWIHRLIFYAKNKEIGLVGPVTNNIGNEAKININYNPNNIFDIFKKSKLYTSSHFGKFFENDRIAAFCWIKRKEIYDKIGGFDELFFPVFFEDDDYCLRVKKAGYQIIIVEDVFIHHELGKTSGADTNITDNKFFIENKRKFEEKWKKNGNRINIEKI